MLGGIGCLELFCLVYKCLLSLQIMDNWHYVYALADEGNVFYIGMSKDLEARVKLHCMNGYECTNDHIVQMRISGRMPQLIVISIHQTKHEAATVEKAIIQFHSAIGHKIYNRLYNTLRNTKISCIADHSIKPNRLPKNYAKEMVRDAFKQRSERFFYNNSTMYFK